MLFATDTTNWLLSKLQRDEQDLFAKVNMDHYLEQFTFGDAAQTQQIQAHFAEFPEHTKLDMVSDQAERKRLDILNDWDTVSHMDYFKYVSIVPHSFVDTSVSGKEVDYRSYSYALSENKKDEV